MKTKTIVTKPRFRKATPAAAAGACLLLAQPAFAVLTVDGYLSQVKRSNGAVRSALETSQAAEERSSEGDLVTGLTVFGNATLSRDERLPQISFFSYDALIVNSYTLGIQKQFDFGLQAKLSHNVTYLNIAGPQFPGGGASTGGSSGAQASQLFYHEARPTLELTQPIWGGGFGRNVRATKTLTEASALATHYQSRFQAKGALAQAEGAYWRLAIARQVVAVQKGSLERAQKIYDWSARRAKLNLGDRSDLLQAEAALNLRKLELQAAFDEEHVASREFNTARGVKADKVTDKIASVNPDAVEKLGAPARSGTRDDVRAAEQRQRLAQASSVQAQERNRPTLDAFGSLTLNGRKPELSPAHGSIFPDSRETAAVGVRFSMPLNAGLLSSNREAYRREENAAQLAYQHTVFEQDQDWEELKQRLVDAKRRLKLADAIEETQAGKLTRERQRFENGRSTTFQVLQFQQDYSQAQLARVRSAGEVLGILTQMKLFGGEL